MKLIALLAIATACVNHSDPAEVTLDADLSCHVQAEAWCTKSWTRSYPELGECHELLHFEIARCRGWYEEECLTGDAMVRFDHDTCMADIASNERTWCVPLSCAASWSTGAGKDQPSHWCQI
jgi:hypothetical protein